jgi:hypothetical protein
MKILNRRRKGIKIQILILRRKRVVAMSPPSAKAPLSPIKILAGLILKNINPTKQAIVTPSTVVAI